MSILITCGFFPGLDTLGGKILEAIDVLPPDFDENISPQELTEKYRKSRKLDLSKLARTRGKTHISRAWEVAVSELVIGHFEESSWGWVDQNSAYLLDFWKNFDPSIRFLFLYTSPARCLELAMKEGVEASADELLENWRLYFEHILEFFHRNREKCLLVNVDTLPDAMGMFYELTREQLGLLDTDPDCDKEILEGLDDESADLVFDEDDEDELVLMENSGAAQSFEAEELAPSTGLVRVLSRSIAQANEVSSNIYNELECSADMTLLDIEDHAPPSFNSAWSQYAQLLSDRDACAAYREQLEEHRELSSTEEEKYEARIERLQTDLEFAEQERSLLQSQLFQTQEEMERLEANRLKYKHDFETLQARNATPEDKERFSQRITDLERDLSKKSGELAATKRELDVVKSGAKKDCSGDLKRIKGELEESHTENELLLRQLHQVQEELEREILKQREKENALAKLKESGAEKVVDMPPSAQPSNYTLIDLRSFIEGTNWYYGESDGRWAGPDLVSTLKLPRLEQGTYTIKLGVVSAMAPEIVDDLSIDLNGKTIPLRKLIRADLKGRLAPLKRLKSQIRGPQHPYPILVSGRVEIGANANQDNPVLTLRFPKAISPMDRGEEDSRLLTIMFETIELQRVR